jgi:hypothetical protein
LESLRRRGIPIIPSTTFLEPTTFKQLCDAINNQLIHSASVYVKRALYSEAADGVTKIADKITGTKNKHLQEVFKAESKPKIFIIQNSHPELEHGSGHHELKLYLLNGRYSYGFAQVRSEELGNYQYEELRQDSAENWKNWHVDEAINFAYQVHNHVAAEAPTLFPFLRVDMVWSTAGGNFVVNEVEHFGNMWLNINHSSLTTLMPKIVNTLADCISKL